MFNYSFANDILKKKTTLFLQTGSGTGVNSPINIPVVKEDEEVAAAVAVAEVLAAGEVPKSAPGIMGKIISGILLS